MYRSCYGLCRYSGALLHHATYKIMQHQTIPYTNIQQPTSTQHTIRHQYQQHHSTAQGNTTQQHNNTNTNNISNSRHDATRNKQLATTTNITTTASPPTKQPTNQPRAIRTPKPPKLTERKLTPVNLGCFGRLVEQPL